jgi:TonB family protein
MKAIGASVLIAALLSGSAFLVRGENGGTVDDKDINVVDFEDLRYPSVAQSINNQGVVVVRATLDDQGKITNAVAISGAALLIHACLENVRKWRFEPNSEKSVVIVYDFRIKGACHPDSVSSQLVFYPPNFVSITGCTRTVQP